MTWPGRIIDPLGNPLDGLEKIQEEGRWPVLKEAPPILDHSPVAEPMQTGLKVVDALIPIGRGQRELILGDGQTGKTAIAVDTIINPKDKDVIWIYCAIGQRSSSIAKVVAELKENDAMDYSLVVLVEALGEQIHATSLSKGFNSARIRGKASGYCLCKKVTSFSRTSQRRSQAVGASAALMRARSSMARSVVLVTWRTHTRLSQLGEASRIRFNSARTLSMGTV